MIVYAPLESKASGGGRKYGCGKHSLFVTSLYTPTNCSTDTQRNKFYDNIAALVRRSKDSDFVVVEISLIPIVTKVLNSMTLH